MRRNLRQIVTEGLQLLFKDIMSAKWAIIVIVAYFVLLKNILHSLCPMVLLTGMPCPGCGMTRAGFKVLHFDFAGAWRVHPFIYAVIVLAVIFAAERYIVQSRSMTVFKWCAAVTMTGLILFYIWRMARFFPNVEPMTYYRHNLIQRIHEMFVEIKTVT